MAGCNETKTFARERRPQGPYRCIQRLWITSGLGGAGVRNSSSRAANEAAVDVEDMPIPPAGSQRGMASPFGVTSRSFFGATPPFYLDFFGRWRLRSRTPGPPPFSSMNSTPANSREVRMAESLGIVSEVLSSVTSARLIVATPTADRSREILRAPA